MPILFILSIGSAMSILYLTNSAHNISSIAVLLALPIFLLFKYSNNFTLEKKHKITHAIFAFAFSASIFVGKTVYERIENPDLTFPLHSFVYLLLFAFFFYCICKIVSSKILSINFQLTQKNKKYIFPIAWIIILICWIPYILSQYPAAMTYDSVKQLKMAMGELPLTDHHPVLHTLFIRLTLWVGGGNVFIYSISQVIIMSGIFAFAVYWIYKQGLPKYFSILSCAWFALNPLHAVYSMNMHKDVLFGGFVLLFSILISDAVITKLECTKKATWIVAFSITSLLVCFMRNNGFAAVFGVLILAIILYKPIRVKALIFLSIFLIIFGCVKGPVFSAIGVKSSSFAESVGIPLQQIARSATENELSGDIVQRIEVYIPIEEMREKYDPYCVDPLKSDVYSSSLNHDALNENKLDFLKLWGEMLIKYPISYVNAYLDITYGYWYTFTPSYVASFGYVAENDLGIESAPVSPDFSHSISRFVQPLFDMKIPVLNILFSVGGMVFIAIFAMITALRKHGRNCIFPYLPIILLWLTLLIAAPISSSLRYLYSVFTTMPILITFIFIETRSKSDEK